MSNKAGGRLKGGGLGRWTACEWDAFTKCLCVCTAKQMVASKPDCEHLWAEFFWTRPKRLLPCPIPRWVLSPRGRNGTSTWDGHVLSCVQDWQRQAVAWSKVRLRFWSAAAQGGGLPPLSLLPLSLPPLSSSLCGRGARGGNSADSVPSAADLRGGGSCVRWDPEARGDCRPLRRMRPCWNENARNVCQLVRSTNEPQDPVTRV